jgi:hypothetical protein
VGGNSVVCGSAPQALISFGLRQTPLRVRRGLRPRNGKSGRQRRCGKGCGLRMAWGVQPVAHPRLHSGPAPFSTARRRTREWRSYRARRRPVTWFIATLEKPQGGSGTAPPAVSYARRLRDQPGAQRAADTTSTGPRDHHHPPKHHRRRDPTRSAAVGIQLCSDDLRAVVGVRGVGPRPSWAAWAAEGRGGGARGANARRGRRPCGPVPRGAAPKPGRGGEAWESTDATPRQATGWSAAALAKALGKRQRHGDQLPGTAQDTGKPKAVRALIARALQGTRCAGDGVGNRPLSSALWWRPMVAGACVSRGSCPPATLRSPLAVWCG